MNISYPGSQSVNTVHHKLSLKFTVKPQGLCRLPAMWWNVSWT